MMLANSFQDRNGLIVEYAVHFDDRDVFFRISFFDINHGNIILPGNDTSCLE